MLTRLVTKSERLVTLPKLFPRSLMARVMMPLTTLAAAVD